MLRNVIFSFLFYALIFVNALYKGHYYVRPVATRSPIRLPRSFYASDRYARFTNIIDEDEEETDASQSWLKTLEERSHGAEKGGSFTTMNVDIETLSTRLRNRKLNLFPEFQRAFVWKEAKASRLIATVIENRMVPAIVIHQRGNGLMEVVDGKQRLCAILAFMMAADLNDRLLLQALHIPIEKFEVLSGLTDEYDYLNGKSFKDLPEAYQSSYKLFLLTYTKIPQEMPDDTVFNIFSDINSGGVEMQAQQIRRASYFGEYIKRLDHLSLYDKFARSFSPLISSSRSGRGGRSDDTLGPLKKLESEKDALSKEADKEALLRAIALRKQWDEYKTPMKTFLNRELKRVNEMPPDSQEKELNKIEDEFKEVIDLAWEIFDEHAFRDWKFDSKSSQWQWGDSFSQIDFEIMFCTLAELQLEEKRKKVEYVSVKDNIVSMWKRMKETKKYKMSKNAFRKRCDELKSEIRVLLSRHVVPKDSRRLFPVDMKNALYKKQEGVCPLCRQSISQARIMECEIDHITPHALGGRTEGANAQLVHSHCNRTKGAKFIQ